MKNPGVIYEMSKDNCYRAIISFIYVGFEFIIMFSIKPLQLHSCNSGLTDNYDR